MNCAECREKLVEYIEDLLPPEQHRRLTAHIKSCHACRMELEALTVLGQRIASDVKTAQVIDLEDAVLSRIFGEQNRKFKQTAGTHDRLYRWRLIMKSPLRFTAAAIILIVAVLSLTLFDTVAPAYAIEQTIAALRQVQSVHARFNGDASSNDTIAECWVKIDPNTGDNESFCIEDPVNNIKVIKTPQKHYTLDRKANRVTFRSCHIGNVFHFGHAMEYITKITSDYTVTNETDERTGGHVIVISATLNECPVKAFIDPDSKLLIRMELNGHEGLHSIEVVGYNEPFPPGLFDMTIPPGAEVVDAAEDAQAAVLQDPANGMALAEEVSWKGAACQLVKEYWQAMIKEDYQTAQRLRPSPEGAVFWKSFHDEMPPVELLEVGDMEEYGWIPCRIRFEGGRILNLKMYIYLRQTGENRSIMISAMKVEK